MSNKDNNQPRSIYKHSAAEKMLQTTAPPSPTPSHFEEAPPLRAKKYLIKTTGYFRADQVKFIREFCNGLRVEFNNEKITPPLLERVLLELWDKDTPKKVKDYLRKQGYDKSQ